MTQSGTGGYGGGADFHLPAEILAVIPTDPYEQLDLARKVTSMAIASRVSKLDLENGKLREKVAEKDRVIAELQDKLSQLDRMFQEADARLRVSLEENIKLSKERDSLAQTSKKLARDLAKMMKKFLQMNLQFSTTYVEVLKEKYLTENGLIQEHQHMVTKRQKTSSVEASFIRLERCNLKISADCLLETFKRHLMQSLNDNNSSSQETVDIRTYDQSVAKASSWKEDEGTLSRPASNLISVSAEMGNMIQDATKPAGSKFFISPQMTPHLTPTATPKIQSTSGSPRQHSTAGSPKLTSGATSPSKPRFEGHIAMSPWYPSSQQSSAASSPPRGRSMPGRTPRIDGKEFFRQARSRLSYEQFGAFLANIKELNAHKQSREETLKKAEEIFGRDNKDLYVSFQSLLNRSLR